MNLLLKGEKLSKNAQVVPSQPTFFLNPASLLVAERPLYNRLLTFFPQEF
jgi:hypothetical protein